MSGRARVHARGCRPAAGVFIRAMRAWKAAPKKNSKMRVRARAHPWDAPAPRSATRPPHPRWWQGARQPGRVQGGWVGCRLVPFFCWFSPNSPLPPPPILQHPNLLSLLPPPPTHHQLNHAHCRHRPRRRPGVCRLRRGRLLQGGRPLPGPGESTEGEGEREKERGKERQKARRRGQRERAPPEPPPLAHPLRSLPLSFLSFLPPQSGVCRDFINYFREHIDELGDNPSDAAIKEALGKAPIPSGDCCTAVRPFIDNGCPCDSGVISLSARANIKASTLRTLSRAVPASACSAASYGPNVKDHCSASVFAQITAQVAEAAAEDAAEAATFAATLKQVAEAEKAVAEAEEKAESEPVAQASTEEAKTEEKE